MADRRVDPGRRPGPATARTGVVPVAGPGAAVRPEASRAGFAAGVAGAEVAGAEVAGAAAVEVAAPGPVAADPIAGVGPAPGTTLGRAAIPRSVAGDTAGDGEPRLDAHRGSVVRPTRGVPRVTAAPAVVPGQARRVRREACSRRADASAASAWQAWRSAPRTAVRSRFPRAPSSRALGAGRRRDRSRHQFSLPLDQTTSRSALVQVSTTRPRSHRGTDDSTSRVGRWQTPSRTSSDAIAVTSDAVFLGDGYHDQSPRARLLPRQPLFRVTVPVLRFCAL